MNRKVFLKWLVFYSVGGLLGLASFVGIIMAIGFILSSMPFRCAAYTTVIVSAIIVSIFPAMDMAEREARNEKN